MDERMGRLKILNGRPESSSIERLKNIWWWVENQDNQKN